MRPLQFSSIFAIFLAIGPLAAQQPRVTDEGVHIVDPGDTLWDLARTYLSNPFRWQEIFSANRQTIENPDLIYPDERLIIPGAAGSAAPQTAARDATAVNPASVGRTVFAMASPAASSGVSAEVREASAMAAAPVPRGAYLAAGILVPEAHVSGVGALAEVVAPTVIPRTGEPLIQPYDRVFMTLSTAVEIGDAFQLFRPDRQVPPFGRIYLSTGTAEVVAVDGAIATVEIRRLYDEVRIGDVAVRMPEFAERLGAVPVPAGGLEGVLLALDEPQPLVSREDLAFVNLGQASGVVEGDEFVIYIPETRASWGTRPAIDVARVQVVRTELLTSAVRVVSMTQPAIEPGLPVRLVAKMP